jgi:hypothetical protein
MENQGWISIHRKIIDWDWYYDINACRVFIHLLLTANHKQKKWKGITIKRGEKLTSIKALSNEVGLSEQQTRTALKKLISTSDITSKTSNKYSVISIVKYDSYQDNNKQDNNQITINQQSNNNQITTNNNDNNKNNENKLLPDWLPQKEWFEFLEHRIDIKQPMSELAKTKLINKLDKLRKESQCPKKLLDRSILNKWKDVFAHDSTKIEATYSHG